MKELKFRVYTKFTKKMSSNEDLQELLTSISKIGFVDGLFLPKAKDNVVMQYTGIKDINGKEIFEGDIVKCTGMIEIVGVVEFKDCEFCIKYKGKYDKDFNYMSLKEENEYNDGKCKFDFKNTFEVIGNIYDNKELLNY